MIGLVLNKIREWLEKRYGEDKKHDWEYWYTVSELNELTGEFDDTIYYKCKECGEVKTE